MGDREAQAALWERDLKTETVYVRLRDLNVWRPVMAERVSGKAYRLLDSQPENETWEFPSGCVVRCEVRRLGTCTAPDYSLVAYALDESGVRDWF